MLRKLSILVVAMLTAHTVNADELTRKQRDLFEIHVRPTLTKHCLSCHSGSRQEGGLRLSRLQELLKGGDSGPAIAPGKPDESLLLEALRYESFEMPPESPLPDDKIEGIAQWIRAGAPWPAEVVLSPPEAITDDDREWWCFQPLSNPQPPTQESDRWSRGSIDRFIWQRLADEGIEPAAEADPVMLTRRVHFAVLGLPPDPAAVEAAASDSFDYDALVDRLLESEEYGRNQARFWLDLVRYAETDGYRADFDRPHAHQYRDYVIRSFNDDKPYDQFVREQLAGDEIDPGNKDALVATMYLRHWIYEHNQRDVETQWHEILSDITETTSDVFLAQGLKCARCHDHKFDPLLQKDYFRFKAFFAAFQPSEAHPIADLETLSEYRLAYQKWEDATRDIRKRLREIEHPVLLEHATREGFDKFIPKIKRMIQAWPEDRGPYEEQIASLAARQYDLPHDQIEKWLNDEQIEERKRLRDELASFDSLKPEPLPTMPFVGSDVGPIAPPTWIPDDPSEVPIEPGFLTLLTPEAAEIVSLDPAMRSTGRRTTLANWISSPENPLTARVIVNRVWQQHFGRGLVETASDFGRLGSPPSHPELLDWLARKFMEDGWSLKKLHRRILTSATYRQTSLRPPTDKLRKLDPENIWLWRMSPRRLAGEEVNDAILAASGELADQRRAIYKPVKRNKPDPMLAAFDGTDRIRSVGQRHQTTTAKQALLLGNGDWMHDRAAVIAHNVDRVAGSDSKHAIRMLYQSLFARLPTDAETEMAADFLESYRRRTPAEDPPNVFARMPSTNSQAVSLTSDKRVTLQLAKPPRWDKSSITIEAVVLLRSLYADASVRTIVANWTGNKSHSGWSLGVTSTKSAYKPRNLILQVVGKRGNETKMHYEVLPSNLHLELNKPYYVAVSIDWSDPSEQGIQFAIKDLSAPGSKLQTANAKHTVTRDIFQSTPVMIGGRSGSHLWDGLVDRISIEAQKRDLTAVVQADSDAGLPDYLIDWQFNDRQHLGLDSSGNGYHAESEMPRVVTPRDRARVALIHALLNSNEFMYVD